jgi:voltage-gated potassium channel
MNKVHSQVHTRIIKNNDVNPFQLFMLILSLYVLISLFIQATFKLSDNTTEILRIADNFICLFFFIDFIVRFYQAENKRQYMKWGWIDLLSSIPMVDQFRYARLIRVARILRVLRGLRSAKVIFALLFKNRFKATFSLVSSVSIILVSLGAIAILIIEKDQPGSNINNGLDALWWSFVTITTVGYGDYYPISTGGRIVAAALMTAGVGLFGTFTGFVSSWFVEGDVTDRQAKEPVETPTYQELKSDIIGLKQDIAELKALLKQ